MYHCYCCVINGSSGTVIAEGILSCAKGIVGGLKIIFHHESICSLKRFMQWVLSFSVTPFSVHIAYTTRARQIFGLWDAAVEGGVKGGSQTGWPLPPHLCFSGPVRKALCIVTWYHHIPSHHTFAQSVTSPKNPPWPVSLDECNDDDDDDDGVSAVFSVWHLLW